jgi:hypothetical protein
MTTRDRSAFAVDVGTVDVRIEKANASYCPTTRIRLFVSHPHHQVVGDSFVFLSIEDAKAIGEYLVAVAGLAAEVAQGETAEKSA